MNIREKILFDEGWQFHRGDIAAPEVPCVDSPAAAYRTSKVERMLWGPASRTYEDGTKDWWDNHTPATARWQTVSLPHDYVILGEPSADENCSRGYFAYENAWYRKHFSLSDADRDKRITLLFEGVATHATVYLNGALVGRSFSGYAPFELDITSLAEFGRENVLAVYVDATAHEGWWYEGGGIYRHVWLCKTAPVAVDLWGVHVKPKKEEGEEWSITVDTTVRSILDGTRAFSLVHRILDEAGREVAACTASDVASPMDTVTVSGKTSVTSPVLWDLLDAHLYTVQTELFLDGEVFDCTACRFGFREFALIANDGLYLNGRRVYLNGVCAHNDCGLFGRAVPDNIHRYKVEMLKEMGANGYRTAHYPHAEATMDALDEAGFIVLAETRRYELTDEALSALKTLIRRDRNRPSVFAWSLGNEEPYHTKEQGARIFRGMKAVAKKLDDTRPFTTAVSNDPANAAVYDDCDIIAVNYNLDTYEKIHEKQPNKLIFASECCATSSTRGWYRQSEPSRGYMLAYDGDTSYQFLGRERTWQFMKAQPPYLIGGYQWDSFEHRGETLWPRLCSQAGAIDLFLQKKDAFYQNISHWTDAPMLHLLPHWNHEGREGEDMEVWAYTNCSEAELFLDGESLGTKKIEPYGHGAWVVPYRRGTLVCIGRRDGKPVARDEKKTTGKPVALALVADTRALTANGQDAALFTCFALDADGNRVPDAAPTVSFECNELGTVVATGSDVCDHSAVSAVTRKMYAGSITVAVRVKKAAGVLRLAAHAEGLTAGSASLVLLPSDTALSEEKVDQKGQND